MTWVDKEQLIEYDEDQSLHCPRCRKRASLHHTVVTSFDRPEDDQYVMVTSVRGDGGAFQRMENAQVENPSPRRDAVRIAFECEQCGPGLQLNIVQHKGDTYLYWTIAK
ncbi:MAG TPA: hypothetical protein VI504_04860 [Candidatus Eisenbacteria bacterium]